MAAAVSVTVAAVLLAGCWGDEVPALDLVGATRDLDGEVILRFAGCPGDAVERVELFRLAETPGSEPVELWEIEPTDDVDTAAFLLGETRAGFREIVALEQPLGPAHEHLFAVVTSERFGTIPMSFRLQDLRGDRIRVRQGRDRTEGEFLSVAASRC